LKKKGVDDVAHLLWQWAHPDQTAGTTMGILPKTTG
jgi:hypothetical protein